MAPDSNQQPPNTETPDEDKVYFPGVEAPPRRRRMNAEMPATDKVLSPDLKAQQHSPNAEIPGAQKVYPFGANVEPHQQHLPDVPAKAAINPTYMYAGIGAGLGVLVAVVISATLWQVSRQSAPRDFPPAVSIADGLRGRLVTEWDERPEYRLIIGPNDPQQLAGFSLAIGHFPRPLTFDIQLKDSLGFVLCGKNILVKYDPRQAPGAAVAASASPAGKNNAEQSLRDHEWQEIELTKLAAVELEREVGKDIFQDDIGQNGQIESISSQGSLPCSRKAYEGASAWSFSSNFPTLAEQAALLNPQTDSQAIATPSAAQTSAVRRTGNRKPPKMLSSYYVEGDDQIVAYDAATGTIQTTAARTSFIDKAGTEANAIKGHDLPIDIHYRCDQAGNCILTGGSGLALHVRLRK